MFEWLQDYKKLKRRIEYLEFKIEQSEEELKRWTFGDLKNTRQTSESLSAKLENNIERDQEALKHLKTRRDDLRNFIDKFDDLDSKILKMKYIDNLSLYEIAEELAYSYSHIRTCHTRLVKTIQFYDDNILDELTD